MLKLLAFFDKSNFYRIFLIEFVKQQCNYGAKYNAYDVDNCQEYRLGEALKGNYHNSRCYNDTDNRMERNRIKPVKEEASSDLSPVLSLRKSTKKFSFSL